MRYTIKQLRSIKRCEMFCPSTLAQTNYDSVQNPGWFFDMVAHNYTTQFFRGLFHKPIFQDPYKPISYKGFGSRCSLERTDANKKQRRFLASRDAFYACLAKFPEEMLC